MKQFPTAIAILVTISAFICFALIPLGCDSEKTELESKVDAFLKANDHERAINLVDRFLEEHPNNSMGYAMLEKVISVGSAYLNADDRKRALKLIDGYIQQHPDKPIGRAMMVRVLAADGQSDRAFTEYYRFYKLSETISPQLLIEIGRGALKNSDSPAKDSAQALAELSDDRSATNMLDPVKDGNGSARLGKNRDGYTATKDFYSLTADFYDSRGVMRIHAIGELGELEDKRAVLFLIGAFNDRDQSVRRAVASALGKAGDTRAVPALVAALKDRDGLVRFSAAKALAEFEDRRAIPALIEAFNDSNQSEIESQVIFSLESSKDNHEILTERAYTQRWDAARALGKLRDKRAVPALIGALNDSDGLVRVSTAKALAELGDERGVSALINILNDSDDLARACAAEALGGFSDDRVVFALMNTLSDNDYGVRWYTVSALGKLRDKRAVPALIRALSSDGGVISNKNMNQIHMMMSGMVQLRAAEALAKLGDERGVPHLMTALNGGDDDMRGNAAVALAELGDESIAPKLVQILGGDESIDLKFWAAEALVKLSR